MGTIFSNLLGTLASTFRLNTLMLKQTLVSGADTMQAKYSDDTAFAGLQAETIIIGNATNYTMLQGGANAKTLTLPATSTQGAMYNTSGLGATSWERVPVLLSSGSLAGSASVTFPAFAVSSTYTTLKIILIFKSESASDDTIQFRTGTSTIDTTAANYNRSAKLLTNSTTTVTYDSGAIANLVASVPAGSNANSTRYTHMVCEVPYYSVAAHKHIMWKGRGYKPSTAENVYFHGASTWMSTSTIGKFQILTNSGSNFSSLSSYEIWGE